jgi:hypothetical protein
MPTSAQSGFWTFLGNLLGILLVQGVTLYIFYNKLADDRRKEENDRNAAWQQFQQTRQAEVDRDARALRMNMKREVYMEIAPAIQRSSALLAEYLRIEESVQKIQNGIRLSQKRIQQSIAKVVPVASDGTLDAMRALQAAFVASGIRLVKARVAFDATKTERTPTGTQEAMHALFDAWVREAESLPPLMADLASSIRKELEMPFDRKRFEDGMKRTNSATIQMMRDELLRNG